MLHKTNNVGLFTIADGIGFSLDSRIKEVIPIDLPRPRPIVLGDVPLGAAGLGQQAAAGHMGAAAGAAKRTLGADEG